jgi:CBS domain-containing protein
MLLVKDLLEGKAREVWSIEPQATVHRALELMAEKNVGALPVVEGGRLVGMISERDHARKVTLKGKSSLATSVREVMSSPVIMVSLDTTIEQCMGLVTTQRVRHLPVMENGQLIGIVSIGDILKATITDQQVLIQDLENFITGARR